MTTWHTGPMPPNPYAAAPDHTEALIRERLATVEAELRHSLRTEDHQERAITDLARRVHDLERIGGEAIAKLQPLLTLEPRVRVLESGWWIHLQPHVWKLWAMIGLIILARIYKATTGASLDIIALLSLLKGG